MQTATAGSRALKPLVNERDVHVHQKVVAPFVIERVVAVHEVDDDAGARAPCLRGGITGAHFFSPSVSSSPQSREPPLFAPLRRPGANFVSNSVKQGLLLGMSSLVFCAFSDTLCGFSPERQNRIQLKRATLMSCGISA